MVVIGRLHPGLMPGSIDRNSWFINDSSTKQLKGDLNIYRTSAFTKNFPTRNLTWVAKAAFHCVDGWFCRTESMYFRSVTAEGRPFLAAKVDASIPPVRQGSVLHTKLPGSLLRVPPSSPSDSFSG